MATTVVKKIGPGGDYTTLQSWTDACPANLVAADQIWQGQCKVGSSFVGSSTLLLISGSTTDATRYKELTVQAGGSFADNPNVRTNALRYNTANGVYISASHNYSRVISAEENYARFTKLQVAATGASRALDSGPLTLVSDCIVTSFADYTAGVGGTVRNVLMSYTGAGRNEIVAVGNNAAASIENCTIVSVNNCTVGLTFAGYSGNSVVKNCAIFGCTTVGGGNSDNRTTFSTSYSNATSRPTGVTLAAYDTTTGSGFENIALATRDYRIKDTSALKNTGATIAGYSTDISGTTRTPPWDVGCWEIAGAAIVPPTLLAASATSITTSSAIPRVTFTRP